VRRPRLRARTVLSARQLRSLRQVVLADVNTTPTLNPQARKRRITFLFLVAVSQVVYMGVLVRA
jgi:hypothetical protein